MRTQNNQHQFPFGHRLAQEALRIQEQINSLPPGNERELLVRKVRQLETASHVNEWLASPGLRAPK
jgi:hypothetical protein